MSRTVKILLVAMVVLVGLTFVVATSAVLAYGALKMKPAFTGAFLGVKPQVVIQREIPQLQSVDNQKEAGVLIASVQPDSPAENAGLVRGDILLELNNTEVNTFADLAQAIAEYAPGDTVDLYILHGDENKTLSTVLGDQGGKPYLGIAPCGCAIERDLSIVPTPRLGFIVAEVIPGGPAEEAGLEAGDHIVKMDDQDLERGANLAKLIAAKNPGDSVTLEVVKPGQEPRQVTVTLGEHPEKEGLAYLGIRLMPAPQFRPHLDGFMPPDSSFPHMPDEEFMHPFEGERFEMPEGFRHGVLIAKVISETPAQAAGLQQGDVITTIDDEDVITPEEVTEIIQSRQPGDEISLTIHRPGESEPLTVDVVLGQHPELESIAYLGVNLSQMMRYEFHHDGEMPEGLPFFEEFFDKLPSIEPPPPSGEL